MSNDITRILEKMLDSLSKDRSRTDDRVHTAKNTLRYLIRQSQMEPKFADAGEQLLLAWRQLRGLSNLESLRPYFQKTEQLKTLRFYYNDIQTMGTDADKELSPTKFPRWEATHFFKHLHSRIKDDRRIRDQEKFYLMVALRYLEVTAKAPYSHRSPLFERQVWQFVHARLKSLSYMDEFKDEVSLKRKIEEFLR